MPSTFLFVMVWLPTSLCAWSALQLVPLDAPRQRQRNKAEPQAPAALRGETLFYINNGKSAPADVAVHELAHCLGQPTAGNAPTSCSGPAYPPEPGRPPGSYAQKARNKMRDDGSSGTSLEIDSYRNPHPRNLRPVCKIRNGLTCFFKAGNQIMLFFSDL